MIVVLLSYTVGIDAIDRLRPAHLDWLKAGVAEGRLLMAGRKVPVTGGMLLARGSLDDVKAWAATDPFAVEGVAEYSFIEVAPSIVAPELAALKE